MFNYKRVAALEKLIERVLRTVVSVDGVYTPYALSQQDYVPLVNTWLDEIQIARGNKRLEARMREIAIQNCPNKKKGAKDKKWRPQKPKQ